MTADMRAMTTVSPEERAFEDCYGRALAAYVHPGAEEALLMAAFELGRKALAEGFGLLDLLVLHQASASALLRQLPNRDEIERFLARANEFLAQAAAPFEMAYRGWHETAARLRQANEELEARVAQRTAAHREAEERLARAQQIAGIGSWELDLATGEQVWSKELYRLCGLSEEGAALPIAHGLAALVDEADRERRDRWFAELEAGRDPGPIEFRIRRPDGEYRVVQAEGEAVAAAGGTIGRISCTVQDITEKRAADTQLHELNAELAHVSRLSAMGEMAAMVVHELNQPLTAIGNYMGAARGLLDRGDPSAPALRTVVDRSRDQVSRAVQIMQRLRRFVSRGNSEMRSEPLSPLVIETMELLRVGTKTDGIVIRVADELPDVAVLADKIQIQQVLLNLLRNAAEAVADQDNGEIALLADASEAEVEISVVDNGPGLPDEIKAKLFQPFVSTKQTGMGVGLAICHTIISAHNGRLWTEPDLRGGTIFHLTLPIASGGEHLDPSQP
jgi:two-component system sensor kinase FixL